MSHSDEGLEVIASRMIASLLTVFIHEPAVGACTRGLAVWRGMTRQVIYQERRPGRILGFLCAKPVVPGAPVQGYRGRPLSELRALLEKLRHLPEDADQASVWLDTVDLTSGQSPREVLSAASCREPGARACRSVAQARIVNLEKLRPKRADAG